MDAEAGRRYSVSAQPIDRRINGYVSVYKPLERCSNHGSGHDLRTINDKAKAIAFYEGKLGFTLVEDQSPFALVFDLNGIMLRATFAEEFTPQQFTILGWHVPDIASAVQELEAAEVVFARYPWMQTTGPLPIWTAPRGAQIAWFNDPFGNVLSLTQF